MARKGDVAKPCANYDSAICNWGCNCTSYKERINYRNQVEGITGLVLFTIGVVVKGVYKEYDLFLDAPYYTSSNLLIASGILLFFFAFFGCCGAVKENRFMLLIFSGLLGLIFILEFAAAVSGYVLSDRSSEILKSELNHTMYQFADNPVAKNGWTELQTKLGCCGLGEGSWANALPESLTQNNTMVPDSCCPSSTAPVGNVTCSVSNANIYKTSCLDAMTLVVHENANTLGSGALCVLLAQIMGIFGALYLARAIRESNYESV